MGHTQKCRHKEVMKRLDWFCKSAVKALGEVVRELGSYLLRPLESFFISPSPDSTVLKLPRFAGDPPWGPEEAKALLREAFREHANSFGDSLTWGEFSFCLNNPKAKLGWDGSCPSTSLGLAR